MRYTFAQLLELQNDLNLKVDNDRVDFIVDGLLTLLERGVRACPTQKSFSFVSVDPNEKGVDVAFRSLSKSELNLILKKLQALGFGNATIERDKSSYLFPIRFVFSWE